MCYSQFSITELVRLNDYDNGVYSYNDDECHKTINDSDFKMHFSIPSRNAVDNLYWFSREEAEKRSIETAQQLTVKYPEKIILVVDGAQSCGGGCYEPPDRVIGFHQGVQIFDTLTGLNVELEDEEQIYTLTEELMAIVRIRQIEVDEEIRIVREKTEYTRNRRVAVRKLAGECHQKIKDNVNMKFYTLNEKGLLDLKNRDENSYVNKSFQAGIRKGIESAFLYLQEHEDVLNFIKDNSLTKEEREF